MKEVAALHDTFFALPCLALIQIDEESGFITLVCSHTEL
jgi:hypothetical protein